MMQFARKKIASGSVYQKTYRDKKGRTRKTATWYLKYYVNGKAIEASSGTRDYDEAVGMLKKRIAAAVDRPDYSDQPERVRMGQLFDLLIANYVFKRRKSTYDTELRVNAHLRPFFGEVKAQALGTTLIEEYAKRRRRQKAEPATVNKELAWLRRSMRLGFRHDPPLVLRVPYFEMLEVDNVREGTVEHDQYRRLRDALPAYARMALVIGYHTGVRAGEIRAIRADKIDFKAMRIFLPGRTTKNGKPRYLPIYGDMKAELDMALSAADRNCPFLIQREGRPVFGWEKAWATACKAAKIPDALFHDLRRTAATNMIEAGLSEKEVMEICGWKTRAMFDRYHIVSERQLKQNAEKLAEHLKAKEADTVQDGGASRRERVQ